MRRRLAVLASALLVLTALPGAVSAAGSRGNQSDHDRIVAYWTPQRMANAKPRDFTMTTAGVLVPAANPGGGIVERQTGRVYFTDKEGAWICSASALSDSSSTDGYSLVLSAGHCAYDGSGGWAENWMYIPDFDASPTYTCSNTLYGCWTAEALVLSSAFVTGGGFGGGTLGYDWSIAVVGPGGKGGTQLDAMGGYVLKTSGNGIGDTAWPFGYPAAGKYHGTNLTYCKGKTVADPFGYPTWGVACDMTGGSSGGPWLVGTTDPAGTAGEVASLNSYGYSGLRYMFGPIFNSHTRDVYDRANTLTPDTAGIDHILVP